MKPMTRVLSGAIAALAASTAVSGVAIAQTYATTPPAPYEQRRYEALGVVDSVETLTGTSQGNRIAGTILGGVIGGVLGHQIGSGRGNDVATVAGALGGAAVGNTIGANKGSSDIYRVRVRMDGGEYRVVEQASLDGLRTGDRVRVDGDRVMLYGGAERNDIQGFAPPEGSAPDPRTYRWEERFDRDGNPDERGRFDREGNRVYDRDGNRIENRGTRD